MRRRLVGAALSLALILCLPGPRAANAAGVYLNCEEYRAKHPDQMSTPHVPVWAREGDIRLEACPREFACQTALVDSFLTWRCTVCKSRNFMEIEGRKTRVIAHTW